ncbi:hypothetical protein, partial [Rhodopseudomonas palustris]
MMLLLLAGIAFLLAGVVAIAFGVPVKEFSFGNTLIISGVFAIGTGAILLALAAVLRELKLIAAGIAAEVVESAERMPLAPRLAVPEEMPAPAAGNDSVLFARDRAVEPRVDVASPAPSGPGPSLPPWQQEAAARDRGRQREIARPPEPEPPVEPAPEPPAKARRNLLFASTSRKERDRKSDTAEPAPALAAGTLPLTFQEAWPEIERPRADPGHRRGLAPPAEPA